MYICSAECKDFFGRSLFFVGEFGVNDYHFSFLAKSVQQVMAFVPDVIGTISTAIEVLHQSTMYTALHNEKQRLVWHILI
jgi:hypothetical protein